MRLDYHYFNLEPGQPAQKIQKIACETAWNLREATERYFLQRSHGLFNVSRHVLNPDPVAIAADFARAEPPGRAPVSNWSSIIAATTGLTYRFAATMSSSLTGRTGDPCLHASRAERPSTVDNPAQTSDGNFPHFAAQRNACLILPIRSLIVLRDHSSRTICARTATSLGASNVTTGKLP